MNHKNHIVITTDVRKALDKLKMEMVKQAQVNIKNIFPALGSKKKAKTKQGKT
jgi:hypothetical protein